MAKDKEKASGSITNLENIVLGSYKLYNCSEFLQKYWRYPWCRRDENTCKFTGEILGWLSLNIIDAHLPKYLPFFMLATRGKVITKRNTLITNPGNTISTKRNSHISSTVYTPITFNYNAKFSDPHASFDDAKSKKPNSKSNVKINIEVSKIMFDIKHNPTHSHLMTNLKPTTTYYREIEKAVIQNIIKNKALIGSCQVNCWAISTLPCLDWSKALHNSGQPDQVEGTINNNSDTKK